MAGVSLRSILEKMDNVDSDHRYMATRDLIAQLKTSGVRTDSDTQKKLCRAVIKLLKDSNSEVQGMSMKCLAPLAFFVEDQHALYLVEKLLEPVVETEKKSSHSSQSGKSMRDVAFLGLKAILAELPPTEPKSAVIAETNIPRILQAVMSDSKTHDVHIEALELLNELLSRMGTQFPKFHDNARKAIFKNMNSSNPVVRKRAIACLGSLGSICSNDIFQEIMSITITNLTHSQSGEKTRTGVQAVWALSRTSGDRLGTYLDVVVPILFEFCTSEDCEKDDELREQCLQAMQSFCIRCRHEMTPFVSNLTKCAIELAKYDPNYAFEESDDEDAVNSDSNEMTDADAEEEDDDFLDFDDGDFSDDDDSSWKVRRASLRCVHAIISGQLLSSDVLYSRFALFLVSRFKEREENVKLDAFAAFIALLRVRGAAPSNLPSATIDASHMNTDMVASNGMAIDMGTGGSKDMRPLLDRALFIVRTLRNELGSRSVKTRVKAMSVLCELVTAAPQTFTPFFRKLVSEVERGLADESASLKTESLLFLKGVVNGGGASSMKDYVGRLVLRILATAEDRYYKISAESLRLCAKILCAFGSEEGDCKNAMRPLVSSIYDAAEKRITASDQDSEVKVASLSCVGAGVSYFGDDLGEERLARVGSTLCGRLKNEVTRLASVRAMLQIAKSNKGNVFLSVASIVTTTVAGFLRKNAPALRASCLELLSSVPALAPECDTILLANVSELISESDLKISHLALNLASSLVRARGEGCCEEVAKDGGVYQKALKLALSPLLQGRGVTSLLDFLGDLARVNGAPLTLERIVVDLRQLVDSIDQSTVAVTSRTSPLCCISKCVAVVCCNAPVPFQSNVSSELIMNIKSQDVKTRVFSLVCLGEFGKRSLLQRDIVERGRVQLAMLEVLDSAVVEVKTAAALALGGLTSASGRDGIPALMQLIRERPDIRYLLLLALKDAIAFAPVAHIMDALKLLLQFLWDAIPPMHDAGGGASPSRTSSGAESVQIAIAECLGLLALSAPAEVLPSFRSAANYDSADIRATVVLALRFAVSASSTNARNVNSFCLDLEPIVLEFVKLVDDSDVTVSKNSLQLVNAIARSRPNLLAPHVEAILSLIYKRTAKNRDLVRVVDLGPFQHEEDFGLDLRKAAFSSMRTLMSGPLSHMIPIGSFIEKVVCGLRDQADVRAIAQLILAAAALSPYAPQIIGVIDSVIQALTATLNECVKENAVRQEVDRHEDSIRGALRAVRMMEKVPEIASNSEFKTFMTSVVQRRFASKYKAIVAETDMMGGKTGGATDSSPKFVTNHYDQMKD